MDLKNNYAVGVLRYKVFNECWFRICIRSKGVIE